MSVAHDPDLEQELKRLNSNVETQVISEYWLGMILTATVLAAAIIVLHYAPFDQNTENRSLLIVCTLFVIASIRWASYKIHRDLVLLMAVNEWLGKKTLDTYDKADKLDDS